MLSCALSTRIYQFLRKKNCNFSSSEILHVVLRSPKQITRVSANGNVHIRLVFHFRYGIHANPWPTDKIEKLKHKKKIVKIRNNTKMKSNQTSRQTATPHSFPARPSSAQYNVCGDMRSPLVGRQWMIYEFSCTPSTHTRSHKHFPCASVLSLNQTRITYGEPKWVEENRVQQRRQVKKKDNNNSNYCE